MHPESSSVVIQADVHDAKLQSNVQHVSGDSREGMQLPDMVEVKRGDPQEDFAMDTDRTTRHQDLSGKSSRNPVGLG